LLQKMSFSIRLYYIESANTVRPQNKEHPKSEQ